MGPGLRRSAFTALTDRINAVSSLDHRGARRIVTGGKPPSEYYYTDDHYESFRRFEIGNGEAP